MAPYLREGWWDELVSLIHVAGFEDKNAADLFLGFGVGAVRRRDVAVLAIEG